MNRFFSSNSNDLFARLNEAQPPAPLEVNRGSRFLASLIYPIKRFLVRLIYPSLAHLFEYQRNQNSSVIQTLNLMRELCEENSRELNRKFEDIQASSGTKMDEIQQLVLDVQKDFLQQNHFRYTENKNLETTVLGFNHDRFWEHRQLEHVLNSQLLDIRTELGNITFTFLHLQKSYEHLAALDQKLQSNYQDLSEKLDSSLEQHKLQLDSHQRTLTAFQRHLDELTSGLRSLADRGEAAPVQIQTLAPAPIVQDLQERIHSHQLVNDETVRNLHHALNAQMISTEEAIVKVQTSLNQRVMVTEDAIRNIQRRVQEFAETVSNLQGLVSTLRKVSLTRDKKKKSSTFPAEEVPLHHPSEVSRSMISDMAVFDLAERFRGREDEVKERQKIYLSYLKDKDPVLDVGCGRGEMLQLLSGNNTKAVGIDANQLMVDYCRTAGLQAIHGDALSYLSSGNCAPFGAIYASHFVEHLLPDQLLQFLSLARERLKNEGVLILETPNPVGLFNMGASFYLDPSHIRPLHPEALKILLESMGFRIVDLQFLSPWPEEIMLRKLESNGHPPEHSFHAIQTNFERINEILFAPRDYSIIAEK